MVVRTLLLQMHETLWFLCQAGSVKFFRLNNRTNAQNVFVRSAVKGKLGRESHSSVPGPEWNKWLDMEVE
jgi:hypothetical protein